MPGPDLDAREAGPTKSGPWALVWFRLALLSRDSVLPGMGGRSTQATLCASTCKYLDKVAEDRQGLAGVRSFRRRAPDPR